MNYQAERVLHLEVKGSTVDSLKKAAVDENIGYQEFVRQTLDKVADRYERNNNK